MDRLSKEEESEMITCEFDVKTARALTAELTFPIGFR